MHGFVVLRRKRLSFAINACRGRAYFRAVPPAFRREIHDRLVKLGRLGQGLSNGFSAVCTENLNASVVVMKSAQDGA
jgi:hypothetical protein